MTEKLSTPFPPAPGQPGLPTAKTGPTTDAATPGKLALTRATPTDLVVSPAHSAVSGNTTISQQVVFSLAQMAALSTYGVVGIASRYTGTDNTQRDPHRGLEITLLGPAAHSNGPARVKVDIHIVVQYGVRIPAVISSLQHQIAYSIEHSTGYIVDEINIHVTGMRVTNPD